MLLLNLDTMIWSGRAKLDESDTPGAEDYRPPRELASAGGIKLIDPTTLDPFGKLKARAVRMLESRGMKLCGGYLIDPAWRDDIENSLNVTKTDWDYELRNFISAYPDKCQEWQLANADWRHLLKHKQPPQVTVAQRFRFGWQTFDVLPAPSSVAGNSTELDMQELPDKAMQSLCDSIYDLYAMSFASKEPSGKAWAALGRLAQRCDALSFVNPDAVRLSVMLANLAAQKNTDLTRLALSQMNTPKAVLDILDNGVQEPEVLPGPPAEILLDEAEALLAPPKVPVFDSMGLF